MTFLSATVTVASIFYEGMVLKWFSYVGITFYIFMEFQFVKKCGKT